MLNVIKKAVSVFVVTFVAAFTVHAQNHATNRSQLFNGQEAAANEVLVKFRTVSVIPIIQAEAAEDVDQAEEVGGAGVLRCASTRLARTLPL